MPLPSRPRAEASAAGSSQTHIDLPLFLFSAQDLADVLAIRRKQSVQIRVLVDLVFAHRSCFEWIDLQCQPAAVYCCRLEAGNNPWTNPLRNVVTPG